LNTSAAVPSKKAKAVKSTTTTVTKKSVQSLKGVKTNQTLVIVESPTKAKTIEKFLGKNYIVKSSFGHIRDLPKSEIGVDPEDNFTPRYITIRGKGDVIKTLRTEAQKSAHVLIASDPDREGESIAWHLQQYLGVDEENCRIEFNEITDKAVKSAVLNPHPIDMNRVESQQARRILDRLVGYKISPLLWKKVKKGLSAGRVQSVTVRLICDREEEIKNFVEEEYWNLQADLDTGKGNIIAKLAKIKNKKADIHNQEEMDAVLSDLKGKNYVVSDIRKREQKRHPAPPFTTSSMQQEASRRLSMVTKKTMQTAQQLYEGIAIGGTVTGLITYMRTDAVRVSSEAQNMARAYIVQKYGKEYIPEKPNVYASKGRIQDAHEAIRPTSVEKTPALVKQYLTPQQFKVYKLIWDRFVASQMSMATVDVTTVDVTADYYLFQTTGSQIRFAGFMQVYMEGKDEKEEEDQGILPSVAANQKLKLLKLDPKQFFTQPPSRYTEAMLVKVLEELGIGRPSTYAPIIETILARGYVVREEKKFVPTELGTIVVDLMKKYFTDIMDVEFTADMEKKLDMVEEGNVNWRDLLRDFYGPFAQTLSYAEGDMDKIIIKPEESGEICELCGSPMVYRMGKFGKFLACSGFPKCRNTKPIVKATNIKCMACGGNIIQCKTKTGRIFFGCDHYPECRYMSWDLPVSEVCPHCNTQMSKKELKNGGSILICPNQTCPAKPQREKKTQTKTAKVQVSKKAAKSAAKKKTGAKSTAKSTTKKTTKTKKE